MSATLYKNRKNAGFTLIEVMIASTVFVMLVVGGISVLILATNNYRSTSEVRQALDTLNYTMEDMARNARLGTVFHCSATLNPINSSVACPVTSSGQMGSYVLAFESFDGNPQNDADQVIYGIAAPGTDTTHGILYKKSKTATSPSVSSIFSVTSSVPPAPFAQITPSDVFIDMNQSGFSVSNSGATSTPVITIRLAGTIAYRTTNIPFSIQTTVAPRNVPQ